MKTVICCINSKYIHSSLAPWYLLAGCRRYAPELDVEVVEGTINENMSVVIDRIVATAPDCVGFCCYIWNIDYVNKVAEAVKSFLPNCIIILGGPEVSYNTKELLCKSYIDYCIAGEGERPLPELLRCINAGVECEFEGVCSKEYSSSPYIFCDEPVDPYCDEYFETLNGRIAYIETTRGCPYSCAFCLSGRGEKPQSFPLGKVKENILKLSNSGTKTVKFVDRTFNANADRANEIISFIIDHSNIDIPNDVCFHFEIAGDILKSDTIELLGSARKGLFQLEIGLQSFNEKTLCAVNRRTNIERLCENIKKLVSLGNMHIHIDLIAGLPFEDINSFEKSYDLAFSLAPNMLQLGFLKLLHGSAMRNVDYPYPCRFSKSAPYEVISTDWLNEMEIRHLHLLEDVTDRIVNSGRFKFTLKYALAVSGKSPFNLLSELAEFIGNKTYRISLDEYTYKIYNFLLKYTDKDTLRDTLVCDRLCSDSSGNLPEFLKVYDDRLRYAKRDIDECDPKRSGVKRAYALLKSRNAVVYVDYDKKDKITGRYNIHRKIYN